jgi:hypothetical protein
MAMEAKVLLPIMLPTTVIITIASNGSFRNKCHPSYFLQAILEKRVHAIHGSRRK